MVDPRSPSDATRAEFARLLEIYGAERRRWPAASQPVYDACAGDMTHAELFHEAAALDGALSEATSHRGDDAFKERLLADFVPRRAREAARPRRRWIRLAPAGAFAALSAMGFVVGSATAGAADEALYYAEAAMEPALTADGLWAEAP
ncbi:MAG: hypothetical protein HXY23_05650 [Parvularculaceae bacterium]|nr:hypothetical protein [Parvularculaceae bacterium]